MSARAPVILVEIVEVLGSFEEACQLIDGAVRRLEREGVSGLASMQFFTDGGARDLAAVIRFSDPDQMIDHMNLISTWDEFKRFATMIKVKEIRIHGEVSPAVRAWMSQFGGPIGCTRNASQGSIVRRLEPPVSNAWAR